MSREATTLLVSVTWIHHPFTLAPLSRARRQSAAYLSLRGFGRGRRDDGWRGRRLGLQDIVALGILEVVQARPRHHLGSARLRDVHAVKVAVPLAAAPAVSPSIDDQLVSTACVLE